MTLSAVARVSFPRGTNPVDKNVEKPSICEFRKYWEISLVQRAWRHGVEWTVHCSGFVPNTQVNLVAKVSLSASAAFNRTSGSLHRASELILQALRDDALPIHIRAFPLDQFNVGVAVMQHRESDQTVHLEEDSLSTQHRMHCINDRKLLWVS